MEYSVTYSSPFWTVSVSTPAGEFPLRVLSFRLDGYMGQEPFEEVVNHTGRLPSVTELIAYQDRDSDTNVSQGDEFMVWEENATLRTDNSRGIHLYRDRDWRSGNFSFSWYLFVQEGYQVRCGSPYGTLDLTPILIAGALGISTVSIMIAFILRRRRSRRTDV
jgi:hypothetical protein